MENASSGITTVLNEKCEWRKGRKSTKAPRKNWPRLRVVNGLFVLLTETAPN